MAEHILEEETFPIVGWAGPARGMIREEVMAGMAEAGFTVSHSAPEPSPEEVRRALDWRTEPECGCCWCILPITCTTSTN